ncbi:MAG: hypothetical protein JWO42_3557, partial [Chloroflexi bacterium]|nr:hypothetical protein [Chloroflexota bacterium]
MEGRGWREQRSGSLKPQVALLEADVLAAADHQVVEHLDVHHLARLREGARDLHVLGAGRRVA